MGWDLKTQTRAAVIAAALLAMACSSPLASQQAGGAADGDLLGWDVQFGGKKDAAGDAKADVGVADGLGDAAPDVAPDAQLVDAADGSDITPTADAGTNGGDAGDTATGQACDFPANPASGEPGAACKTAGDCQSGFCVDSANGKICTQACIDCCPKGFGCSQFTTGTDTAFVCVPQWTALCRPCLKDAECALLTAGSLCVAYGAGGSFCGGPCTQNGDCPANHVCKPSQGENGAGKQCVLQSGECACSEKSTFDGATTACTVSNNAGTCSGQRKCKLAGLSACSAATPAGETCNDADDDCDGITDDGCDDDADGYCDITMDISGLPTACKNGGGDCDDLKAAVHPEAGDLCGNNQDDDCNGLTDESGTTPWYPDSDGDGYGDTVGVVLSCSKPSGYLVTAADCNDALAGVHPGATESCNGIDDNCDGATDPLGAVGCTMFYVDGDSDSYGTGVGKCLCSAVGLYTAVTGGDCADGAAAIHPGAEEMCNGADDDCDGTVDEANATGCVPLFHDEDGDKYGAGTSQCLCSAIGGFNSPLGSDCNDANPAIHPKADEVCNGADDNCDGATDTPGADGCGNFYIDADADGFGNGALASKCLCVATAAYSANQPGDCNDSAVTIFPGATETCNQLDDDCDGAVDEAGGVTAYQDADGDGFGNSAVMTNACAAEGFVADATDCNDKSAAIHPGEIEACDGIDQNCDGQTDEGTCDDGEACSTDVCGGAAGCSHPPEQNGTPCDDGNTCTANDVCGSGTCAGTGSSCADGNVCTTDSCNGTGGCSHVANSLACNDDNACTVTDSCAASTCAGTVVSCEDNNTCTVDNCSTLGGCAHVFVPGACTDGDACTSPDSCADGKCGGAAVVCDDGKPCTLDTCDGVVGCIYTANNSLGCSDNNTCTSGDACSSGACVGTATNCSDGNPCTDDGCDSGTGCTHAINSAPCNDTNACTTADTCTDGGCIGVAVACNDGKPCTDDTCNTTTGCVYANNALTCDDGNACTTNDKCGGGACSGAAMVCNDNNACTNDACVSGVCSYTNNAVTCSDNNACTTGDKCGGGSCAGTPMNCDDGLSCTADSCSGGTCNHSSTCGAGYTCDAATNACKAVVVGCTLPTDACTNGLSTGNSCDQSKTISRKTAMSGTTITADTCSFSEADHFNSGSCTVDGGHDKAYRIFLRKGETVAVVLSNNGTCLQSNGAARLKVHQPADACNTPGYGSCTTLLYPCGTNSPTITANAEGWFVFVADSDSVGEGTQYKLKVTLSNCLVAGCECP